MGSSCSILNDTEHDVWITHEVNWEEYLGITRDVVHACELGARMLALIADEGEEDMSSSNAAKQEKAGAIAKQGKAGAIAKQEKAGAIAKKKNVGWTKNDWAKVICGLQIGDEVLARLLEVSQREVEKMKRTIKEFKEKSELIKPGEKYSCPGTVSLSLRVFVMNDKLQFDDASCYTSSTAGAENFYTISSHFRKLDTY